MADTPPIPLLNSSLAETPTLARSRRRSIRRPTWAGSGFRDDIGAAFSPHYHPQLDAIDHLKGITRLKNSSQSSGQGKISMPFIQSVRLPERQTAFLRSLRSTVTFSKSCHGPSMAT